MDLTTLIEQMEIIEVLNRYATACDSRDWGLFDQVFTPDVETDYGGTNRFSSRNATVDMIQGFLGGCGPTQHLLGNYRITIEGDKADSVCYVRAFHAGIGKAEGKTFEVWAEYQDRLVRTTDGWRIARRTMVNIWAEGSIDVLQPLNEP